MPSVRYAALTGDAPDYSGRHKFKLQSSIIVIDKSKDNPPVIVVKSVPAEEPSGRIYSIEPGYQLGIRTSINVALRENSYLIDSIGTEVQDNRIKYIQSATSILTTGLGAGILNITSPIPTLPRLPIAIDTAEILSRYNTKAAIERAATTPDYSIGFGPLSPTAFPRDTLPQNVTGVFFYSACRDAIVRVRGVPVPFVVRVADPNFWETIALPQKGKISAQSTCGVSVTSETIQSADAIALLAQAMDAAKNLNEAQKKRRNAR